MHDFWGWSKEQPDRFLDLNQGLIFYKNLFFQQLSSNGAAIYNIDIICRN
jgi:hypothetical protein